MKDLPVQKEVRLTWVQMVRGGLQVHQDHWEVLEAATHMPTTFRRVFFHLNSFHLRFNDIFSRNLTKSAFFFCIFHPNSVFGCLGQSRRRLSTESKKQSKVIKQSYLFLLFLPFWQFFGWSKLWITPSFFQSEFSKWTKFLYQIFISLKFWVNENWNHQNFDSTVVQVWMKLKKNLVFFW